MNEESTFLKEKQSYLHPNISYTMPHHDPNFTTTQYIPTLRQSGYIVGAPVAFTNQPSLPANFPPHTPKNVVFHNPHQSTSRVITNSSFLPPVHEGSRLNSNEKVVNLREEMIPRQQYDRCVEECRIWQSKFNELYHNYNSQHYSHKSNEGFENQQLRKENLELKTRIRQLEGRERRTYENLEREFCHLVNKYKESCLKECVLLTDRYRLQKKCSQKF